MLSLNQLTCVTIYSDLLAKADGRLFESTGRNVDVSHTRPFGFRDDSLSILESTKPFDKPSSIAEPLMYFFPNEGKSKSSTNEPATVRQWLSAAWLVNDMGSWTTLAISIFCCFATPEAFNAVITGFVYMMSGVFIAASILCNTHVAARHKGVLLLATLASSIHMTAAAPLTVDLSTFKAGAGARIYGKAFSATGRDVAIIGDHNGDGINDYILSSYNTDSLAVIVMKGNTTNTDLKITDIVSNEYFRVIKGPSNSYLGTAMDGIGDINGDSFDDVLIGCSRGQVSSRSVAGFAVVIFGKEGPFTDVTITASWPSTSVGFMINGPITSSGLTELPRTARGLGDVNGDGVNDFALSSRLYSGTTSKKHAGIMWLIFGKSSYSYSTIDTLPANFGNHGVYFTGAFAGDYFGYSIAAAGDFNGDGFPDILVGATAFDPNVNSITRTDAGAVYLIYGSATDLTTMDMANFTTGTMGVRFLGAVGGDSLGTSMGGMGDVNGDGIDDIALSAPTFDRTGRVDAGIVYILYGSTVPYSADVDLLNFNDFSKGFAIYGRSASIRLSHVAYAGDLNGDGLNDILVGGGSSDSRAHIVYGQTEPRTIHVDTANANVMTFSFTASAALGSGMHGGQDLNGDGVPDLVIGGSNAWIAPEAGGDVVGQSGAVWMLPGPFILPTSAPTRTPTRDPTRMPTIVPTIAPTLQPTLNTTQMPTITPSVTPTLNPTDNPSLSPTRSPTVAPTLSPTFHPSATPTIMPTASPTVTPTARPSIDPSVSPSIAPTTKPTLAPTVHPSVHPSALPTMAPTAVPSVHPSVHPTAAPTVVITSAPTGNPSFRPTNPADKDFELVISVEQELFNVTKTDYDAEKAVSNQTIQHTIADVTDGVIPDRVTDIVVEEEEEEEEEEGRIGVKAATNAVLLYYKITVRDPLLTVEMLRAQLVQAVQEGKMDAGLRHYAAQFGASKLSGGAFGEPQVTSSSTAKPRDTQDKELADWAIAVIVVGGVLILVVLVVFVLYPRCGKKNHSVRVVVCDEGPHDLVEPF